MKERPILWSAPMVLALLAGRKTQTRRIAKFEFYEGQNPAFSGYTPGCYHSDIATSGYVLRSRGGGGCWNDRTKPLKPYALVGDRLWGRETFAPCEAPIRTGHYQYAADGAVGVRADGEWRLTGYTVGLTRGDFTGCWVGRPSKWKPSIFMPRAASRLLHEVTAARVERLQDITEADALSEGIEALHNPKTGEDMFTWPGGMVAPPEAFRSARAAYLTGWDLINGMSSAAKNPWVWVVSFSPAADVCAA